MALRPASVAFKCWAGRRDERRFRLIREDGAGGIARLPGEDVLQELVGVVRDLGERHWLWPRRLEASALPCFCDRIAPRARCSATLSPVAMPSVRPTSAQPAGGDSAVAFEMSDCSFGSAARDGEVQARVEMVCCAWLSRSSGRGCHRAG